MVASLVAAHPLLSADLVHCAVGSGRPMNVAFLPHRVCELTTIQRHVLARVATHCWAHNGAIPYRAPTVHQTNIALALAVPAARLLAVWWWEEDDALTFTLTRLGNLAARRVLHVVPAAQDRAREREFDRMRALMGSAWETHD